MIISLSSLVGRIQLLEAFLLSLFGAFFYEVNNQLLWRLYVVDLGFGMRVFLFGAMMGLVASCLLGHKDTTINNARYFSNYRGQAMGLVGLAFTISAFPLLVAGGLYGTSINNSYILYTAAFNMWFALGAGVLAAFSASALSHQKIFLHDLVHSGLAGAIAYSSSANLHPNPAAPLAIGFIAGFIVSVFNSKALRKFNKGGVVESLGVFNHYILPGVLSGVMSAILYAINQGNLEFYDVRKDPNRSFGGQGAFQLVGIALSAGIAIFGGLVIGVLFKLINKHSENQQYDDNAIFSMYAKKPQPKYTVE